MEINGETRIEASRDAVWAALNNPEVLARVIPGCESLKQTQDGGLQAEVVLKVGPIRARFGGGVSFSEVDPPNSYIISGHGTGGIAGFAKGSAKVHLEEDGTHITRLVWEAHADVGGKLAQLGGRLLDSTAKKLATQFFENFAKEFTSENVSGAG